MWIAFWKWLKQPLHLFSLLGMALPATLLAIFVRTYASPFPFQDTFVVNAETVLAWLEGDLTFFDLFARYHGHINFTTRLFSVILVMFDPTWPHAAELLNNYILGLLIVLLTSLFFARVHPHLVAWVLIPFATLLLSIDMGHTYLLGLMNIWLYPLLFFMLSLLTIIGLRQHTLTVILAGIWSILSMLSLTSGLIAYPAVFLLMWAWGYRKPRYYLTYGLIMVLGIMLFLSVPGLHAETIQSTSTLSLVGKVRYIIIYLGGILGVGQLTTSFIMGSIGLTFWLGNLIYLATQKQYKTIGVWLSISGYSIGSGVLMVQARSMRLGQALNERYFLASTFFWVAVVALMVVGGHMAWQNRARLWTWLNIAAGVGFATMYAVTVFFGIGIMDGGTITQRLSGDLVDCHKQYPFTHYSDCLLYAFDLTNTHLAARHMSGYNEIPQVMMLGTVYQPQDRIIIDSQSAWNGVHIREYLLQGVDPNTILHAVPFTEQDTLQQDIVRLPVPPVHVIDNQRQDADAITDWLGQSSAVWVIRQRQDEDIIYRPTYAYQTILDAQYQPSIRVEGPYGIVAQRYILPPQLPDESPIAFGERVTFLSWQRPADVNVQRCQHVPIASEWMATTELNQRYGITLTLANSDGQGIAADSRSTAIPIYQWDVQQPYIDERGVQIPCNAPAGEYYLLLSVYRGDDSRRTLAATNENGDPLGDQIYLTTLFVND